MPAVVQGSSQGGASFQVCLYSPRPVRSRGEAERGGRIQTPAGQPEALVTSYLYTSVSSSGRWVAGG